MSSLEPIFAAALRAESRRIVRDLFAPLWQELGGNPLAVGTYCPTCGTRLDKADRPCPLGCSDPDAEHKAARRARLAEVSRRAVGRVEMDARFLGCVVTEAVSGNA